MRRATPCSRFASRLTITAGRQLIVVRPRRPTRGTGSYHSRPVSLSSSCPRWSADIRAEAHTGCASEADVKSRQGIRSESISLLFSHEAEREQGSTALIQNVQPPLGVVPVLGPYFAGSPATLKHRLEPQLTLPALVGLPSRENADR